MVITTLNIVNIFHFTFLIFYLFYFTILRHVLKNKSNYININVFLAPYPKIFIKVLGGRSVQGALIRQEWSAGAARKGE